MKEREKEAGFYRKYLAVSLAAVVAGSGIVPPYAESWKGAEAATTLSNPRTDEKGITTWDCVYFGSYWQNDTNGDDKTDKKDEKKPIKWRVSCRWMEMIRFCWQ